MLAAIEQIEDAAAAKWEKDLLLLREYYERLLPDEDRRRIDWRLVLDAEFQRMTVRAVIAFMRDRYDARQAARLPQLDQRGE